LTDWFKRCKPILTTTSIFDRVSKSTKWCNLTDCVERKTRYKIYEYIFVLPYNYTRMILCDLLQTLKEYQIIVTIITMVISGTTVYFLIENRFSIIETEFNPINKNFQIGDKNVFIGSGIEFTIINRTTTLSIIRNQPTVWLEYQYGFKNMYRTKLIEITDKVIFKTDIKFPLTIKDRKGRCYLLYNLRTEFYGDLRKDFENEEIISISIYLKGVNDVTKKEFETEKYKLNRNIYLSKFDPNLPIDTIMEINNKLSENDKRK